VGRVFGDVWLLELLMVKRPRTSKFLWVSAPVHFADDENPLTVEPEKTFNVRYQAFNARPTGSYSSRVSYMPAIASPSKPSRIPPEPDILWNSVLPALSVLDDCSSMDAGYVDYIEEATGLLPRRRRTAGVSFCQNLIQIF
jgi:hypothetical protein